MNTLGERIKMLRENKEVNQQELAKYLNVHKGSISNWENDKRSPDNETLIKIANYFNVTIDFLLGRSDFNNKNDTTTNWSPSITEKDNKHLDKIVDNFEKGLSGDIMLDGEILDNETKELLLQSVRTAYEFAKINNKAKYTPKKFRK